MLEQFAETARSYGLKLHFGKTKVMACGTLSAGASGVRFGRQRHKHREAERSRKAPRKAAMLRRLKWDRTSESHQSRLGGIVSTRVNYATSIAEHAIECVFSKQLLHPQCCMVRERVL